jgi:cytochrome b561
LLVAVPQPSRTIRAVLIEVHKLVGFVIVAIFAVGWIWGLGAWVRKRAPGDRFWTWLAVAQVTAGLQALLGITLLILGKRPDTWLHYVYGFGPIVVLVIAHQVARDQQAGSGTGRPLPPWIPFAAAAFVCFGLALRALMTGLGAS